MLYKVCKQKGSSIKITIDCCVMCLEYFSPNKSCTCIEQLINDSRTFYVNPEFNREGVPYVKPSHYHNMFICISCNNVTMMNKASVYSTKLTNLATPCNSAQFIISHNAPFLEKLYDHIMSSVGKHLSIDSNDDTENCIMSSACRKSSISNDDY